MATLKQKFDAFINGEEDYPLLTGFVSGLYPMVFYYSNNYDSVNSWQHLLFFGPLFLVLPTLGCWIGYRLMGASEKLKPHRRKFLLLFLIMVTATLFSQVYFMTLKKKALAVLLLFAIALAVKFSRSYKKLLVFLGILTLLAGMRLGKVVYNATLGHDSQWLEQPDAIAAVQFKNKPNVYVIEPDGYAGEMAMNGPVYNHSNPFYDWLRKNNFTVYNNTNSNYPASLASNASMFAMKHHYFGRNISSAIEIPNARKVIVADNPVVPIFKNNGYRTFFLAEDEYFQKNFQTGLYDHYNISNSEIPFFSKDDLVKKDVYRDLEQYMTQHANDSQPRFFFVEKLLPHHIHFDGTGKANERKVYLEKVAQTNRWLEKTIGMINSKDPQGIIVIASDHGGWVGMENFSEFYATRNPKLLQSIFGNLIAIKWNSTGPLYTNELRSNVNLFRVMFAHLSGDARLLENLQPDSAYNYQDGLFSGKAVKVIP